MQTLFAGARSSHCVTNFCFWYNLWALYVVVFERRISGITVRVFLRISRWPVRQQEFKHASSFFCNLGFAFLGMQWSRGAVWALDHGVRVFHFGHIRNALISDCQMTLIKFRETSRGRELRSVKSSEITKEELQIGAFNSFILYLPLLSS